MHALSLVSLTRSLSLWSLAPHRPAAAPASAPPRRHGPDPPPPLRIGPAPPRCCCVARNAVDLQEPPLLEVPRLPPSLLEPARGGPASPVPAREPPAAVSCAWHPPPSPAPPATPSREEVQRRQAQALVLPRHRPRYTSISLPIVFWTKFVLWFQLLNNCITRRTRGG